MPSADYSTCTRILPPIRGVRYKIKMINAYSAAGMVVSLKKRFSTVTNDGSTIALEPITASVAYQKSYVHPLYTDQLWIKNSASGGLWINIMYQEIRVTPVKQR